MKKTEAIAVGIVAGILMWVFTPEPLLGYLRIFLIGLYTGLCVGSFALLKSQNTIQETGIVWLIFHSMTPMVILEYLCTGAPKLSNGIADAD